MANALAYYDTATVMSIINFIVRDQGLDVYE